MYKILLSILTGVNVEIVCQCLYLMSVCCKEIPATANKCETAGSDEQKTCITEHEGFEAVCLNVWVLQAGFFSYRYHYGTRDIGDIPTHE